MAELHILSAGAVKPGLVKVIEAFQRQTGIGVHVVFATAPAILEKIRRNGDAPLVIAPAEVLDQIARAAAWRERVPLGRIGVGVFTRNGVAPPRIATIEELRHSLLAADPVVFNRASTGVYLEKLFDDLGMTELIAGKIVRCPDFSAVLDQVRSASDRAIGFGATTVIIENHNRGVVFAGALPDEVQHYTEYFAAARSDGGEPAFCFVDYLRSGAAISILRAAGIG
jgi:molybdate transport system substrate-binding protein